MKHKILIHIINGRIHTISASGDTDIYMVNTSPGIDVVSKQEPDFIFENEKAHLGFMGKARKFLKRHKV